MNIQNIKNFGEEVKSIFSYVKNFYKQNKYYKKNLSRYLSLTNIDSDMLDKIKIELTYDFYEKVKTDWDKEYHKNTREAFVQSLVVESFYNNHELFKILSKDYMYKKDIVKIFNTSLWINNRNSSVKSFKKEDLIQNLDYVNDTSFNELVLSNSLHNNNQELFQLIIKKIHWSENNIRVLDIIYYSIIKNGKNLKQEPFEKEIKKIASVEKLLIKIQSDNEMSETVIRYNDKNEKLLNYFFDIDLFSLFKKENFVDLHLFKVHIKKSKQILKNLDKNHNTTTKILQYLHQDGKSFQSKIKFLKSVGLLNEEAWETIKTKYILNSNIDNAIIIQFLKIYPYKLTSHCISQLMQKHTYFPDVITPLLREAIDLANQKDLENIDRQNTLHEDKRFKDKKIQKKIKSYQIIFDMLYKDYPEIMNNEDFFVKQTSNENNSILLELYLKKYFINNPNESLKKAIVPKLNILNGINSQRILQWVIDNNLTNEINRENFSLKTLQQEQMVKFGSAGHMNVWIPILVEKYKINLDMILVENIKEQYMNTPLIKMVINHYKIQKDTEQLIIENVFNLNNTEMARELFQHGISPSNYLEEKITQTPNESGYILLKSSLKNKLETKDLKVKIKPKKIIKI